MIKETLHRNTRADKYRRTTKNGGVAVNHLLFHEYTISELFKRSNTRKSHDRFKKSEAGLLRPRSTQFLQRCPISALRQMVAVRQD